MDKEKFENKLCDIFKKQEELYISNISYRTNIFYGFLNELYQSEKATDSKRQEIVKLLQGFYYFELNKYKEIDLFDIYYYNCDENLNIDFIFCNTLDVLDKTDHRFDELDNLKDIKRRIDSIIQPTLCFCYINERPNSYYNFREQIIRKYILYYIETNYSRNQKKIIEAFKKSELYKLLNSDISLLENLTKETSLLTYDLYDALNANEALKDEYYLYDNMRLTPAAKAKKRSFDIFCLKLCDWIISNSVTELYLCKEKILEGLSHSKSPELYFKEAYESIVYKNKIHKTLVEQGLNTSNLYELLEKELLTDISDDKIAELQEEIEECYGINTAELGKQDSDCLKFIIQGQYYFNLINKSAFFEDYSGTVIYWSKCVEIMLYKKVFLKIKDKVNDPSTNKAHTLGKIPFLCGSRYRFEGNDLPKTNNDNLKLIEKTILWNEKVKTGQKFEDFVYSVYQLGEKRNLCAHREPISLKCANECKALVFKTAKILQTLMML